MKRIEKLLSTVLVLVMMLSMQMRSLPAFAEESTEEALPLTQTLPSAALEGGHIDGDVLKQWVDAYLEENHWNHPGCDLTVAFWYSGTDETWFYNADEWLGCVNWYKLPVCMHYAEELKSGALTKESVVTGITLEYAMTTVLENSSGPSIYSLVTDLSEREGLNHTDVAKEYAGDLPDSYFTGEYYNNGYTARLMLEITKTLFEGGEERFPFVLEHMKKSQPEDLFKRDWNVRTKWEVAQTHAADWGGEGDDLIHCTGIFYTPAPAILTVMTRNIWDLDIIGGVAGHFVDLAEELGLKQEEEKAAQAAAAEAAGAAAETPAEPAATGEAQQADAGLEAGETTLQTAAQPTAEQAVPGGAPEASAGLDAGAKKSFVPVLILFLIFLLLIIACIILVLIHQRKERERRRRRAAARRRRQRERELQRRYEEEAEEQDEDYDEEE